MKIPKCPKTVSGKHRFIIKEVVDWTKFMSLKDEIKCEYCGLVDDRK